MTINNGFSIPKKLKIDETDRLTIYLDDRTYDLRNCDDSLKIYLDELVQLLDSNTDKINDDTLYKVLIEVW